MNSSISQHSANLRAVPTSPICIQKFAFFRRSYVKLGIPFAAIATSFLLDIPIASAAGFSLNDLNPLQPIIDEWDYVKSFFKNLPHNIGAWSIELMAQLYDLCTSLILKTPLWLFDNDWFKNTTYKFSLLSIGIVSVLTSLEGIKRMLPKKNKKQPMELKEIAKRWFLVAGAITATPYLFQKAFQGLNWLSETLISLGADNMRSNALPDKIVPLDVVILLAFDALLITTIIPVLWKNGRRFFDLLILGATTPFALTAWIFDSYRGLHRQWWESLKHLALVQVFHALYLLVLGWFIFGVPTPTDFSGFVIKLLIVIGGFSRLQSPPRLILKHLDSGKGLDEEITDGYKNTMRKTKKNFELVKGMLTKNPKKIFNTLSKFPSPKIIEGKGK
ncbi:hypothetical protein NSQ62_08145 [Solibacillus sp. FSL H8-0523]|uniref:hypothetical protein n=1 Tax=Solibacillus sp. FSL H8-0523 TaxID=2954511 RepID=UPI003100ECF5